MYSKTHKMECTMLFMMHMSLYKLGIITLEPYVSMVMIFILFQICIINNIFKKYFTISDFFTNLCYIISFIYSYYLEQNIYTLFLFSLMSNSILDNVILKKRLIYMSDTGNQLTLGTSGSAGLDIKSIEEVTIGSYELISIRTGIYLETPKNHFCLLANRSSMAMKELLVMGGIIDSDYRGEIKVMIKNLSSSSYKIHKNDKIAQIICIKCLTASEKVNCLSITDRNTKGFGHTGK